MEHHICLRYQNIGDITSQLIGGDELGYSMSTFSANKQVWTSQGEMDLQNIRTLTIVDTRNIVYLVILNISG